MNFKSKSLGANDFDLDKKINQSPWYILIIQSKFTKRKKHFLG